MKKKKKKKPKLPRNMVAVDAHFRNSKGPMGGTDEQKTKKERKGTTQNLKRTKEDYNGDV